jgi:EmrB/QacA subfamily drug resistance transporter
MAGSMLTLLLAALDNTIVGTAMPKIIRDLHGMEHYSWPFTSYLLMSTIILPISGKLAEIYGRKLVTLTGIASFAAASLLCGLSGNMIILTVFRGLQGLGGGVCISSAFIMVAEIFPPIKRGKYTGMVASMFAVASIFGPGAGGFISDHFSWRWIFFVNIPLGIVAFCLIARFLPHIVHHEDKDRKIDIPGVVAFILASVPFLFAVSQTGQRSFFSPDILSLYIFSLIMLIVFLRIEKNSKEPLLSLHFFKDSIFTSSVLASSLCNMAIFGTIMFLPLFLQSFRGASATHSGFIMMPMMVSMIISSNISGILISKLNRYRPVGATGIFIAFAGMLLLGLRSSAAGIPEIITYSTMTGAGMGVTFPIYNVAPQSIFSGKQIGAVTSILQFFRNMGSSIGSAVFGSLMLARMKSELGSVQVTGVSSQIADAVRNPKILTDPQKIAALRAQVPASSIDNFNRLVTASLKGFSLSIEMIFLISSVILLAAFLTAAFMFDEERVRKSVAEHKKH